ncbi:MAG: hypothetical protein QXX08_05650 [Candidatus Bathyarchaeia archaeon]
MGRTIPSFRMVLEREIERWDGFVRALREDDRKAFEDLMNICRSYASAAGAATRSLVLEAMFMVILLRHQKILNEVEASLEKLKAVLQPAQR